MKKRIAVMILLLSLLPAIRPAQAMQLDPDETLERARHGDRDAAYFVGTMFTTGNGISRDCAKALKWGHAAASEGHILAQSHLGMLYLNGCDDEVPKNSIKAYAWLSLAADQGLRFVRTYLEDLQQTLHPYLLEEARREADRLKALCAVGSD